jgi:hypothetical protein
MPRLRRQLIQFLIKTKRCRLMPQGNMLNCLLSFL